MTSLCSISDGEAAVVKGTKDGQITDAEEDWHVQEKCNDTEDGTDSGTNKAGSNMGDMRTNYRAYIQHALSMLDTTKSEFAHSGVLAFDGHQVVPGVSVEGFGRICLPLSRAKEGDDESDLAPERKIENNAIFYMKALACMSSYVRACVRVCVYVVVCDVILHVCLWSYPDKQNVFTHSHAPSRQHHNRWYIYIYIYIYIYNTHHT
jgi:hypothetical protein